MSVVCELAVPFIANNAVDGSPGSKLFRSHRASCLKCQARHASMSRTARELTGLGRYSITAPPDLEWRVMRSLEDDLALQRSWGLLQAWLAAGLSMAAAVLIWRLRPGPS